LRLWQNLKSFNYLTIYIFMGLGFKLGYFGIWVVRACAKITLHFKRRYIPPAYVPKVQEYIDIIRLSCLVRRVSQRLNLRIYFCANPKV